MLNEAVCDALLRFLGSSHFVAVVKFTNFRELRGSLSLPSSLLAAQRFQAAALSSRTDWLASGSLSGSHVALVLPEEAAVADWDLPGALGRFCFTDLWGSGAEVELRGTAVVVALDGWVSLGGLFAEVDSALIAAELEHGNDPEPNRVERWCTEASSGG